MTEAEWQVCDDAGLMLWFLQQGSTNKERQLWLIAAACTRSFWAPTPDSLTSATIEEMERRADGLIHEEAGPSPVTEDGAVRGLSGARSTAHILAVHVYVAIRGNMAAMFGASKAATNNTTALAVLRDICGNPFHPISLSPTWRTPHALALAQAMYDDRHYEDMPVLADALEEAGCTERAILKHCREPVPHVRGCWVLDLLLGKR
jgi:hypothetical protein